MKKQWSEGWRKKVIGGSNLISGVHASNDKALHESVQKMPVSTCSDSALWPLMLQGHHQTLVLTQMKGW